MESRDEESEENCETTPPRTMAKGASKSDREVLNRMWFRVKPQPSIVAFSASFRKTAAPSRNSSVRGTVHRIAFSEKWQLRRETINANEKDAAAPYAALNPEEMRFLENVQSERETLMTLVVESAAPEREGRFGAVS